MESDYAEDSISSSLPESSRAWLNKILNYELFIFDFDGTLMDTEKFHWMAWNKALQKCAKESQISLEIISFQNYQKYFHTLDNNNQKIILKLLYDINDYDKIYEEKQKYYNEYINDKGITFIPGAENFLKLICEINKKFVIVTNTSINFINIFKEQYPILNKATKIYTKELFINKKPNPECYLRVINDFKHLTKIGFEDSLVGLHALYQVKDIVPVLIHDDSYYHNKYIFENYENIIIWKNYDIKQLANILPDWNVDTRVDGSNDSNLFIDKILSNNINQLIDNFKNMSNIINQISIFINNLNNNNHIYLSGMGKSGYVCKKCASTWQSLSIKCSYIDLPNLPHGDFGIFRDNDILILISNSGNTDEIIYILKYLKYNLKKKINTISIVANSNSEMEQLSNFTYVLKNIEEADIINMTPSTSSLIFMALLDGIAINVKKNITKDDFKLYHPAGSLGKREI